MDNLRGHFGDDSEPLGEGPDYDAFEDDTGQEPPPLAIGQDERRMQVRAYNFWAGLLGDSNLPAIDSLDPAAQGEFGPFSVLLDFTGGIENPAIVHLGDQLANECGTDGPIERLDDVPSRSLLSRITDHYLQILANQAPIGFEAEFVNQRGATTLYRGILLPFSSDAETIDFIYGVINWKELADQAMTDELMLEIEQALDETSVTSREPLPIAEWADSPEGSGDDILDFDSAIEDAVEPVMDIPEPAFSVDRLVASQDETAGEAHDDPGQEESGPASPFDLAAFAEEEEDEDDEDYGFDGYDPLDDFGFEDEDGEEEEEENHGGFASLTSIGGGSQKKDALRANPLEGLEGSDTEDFEDAPTGSPIPSSYDPEDDFSPEPDPAVDPGIDEKYEIASLEDEHGYGFDTADSNGFADEAAVTQIDIPDLDEDEMGLADWLASARDLACAAKASEDRSRRALYEAVGRAYDFSLAAAAEPEEFAALVEDAGLTMQERAPLTPLLKLVFGTDYDKTRLAEFASVLSLAQREGIERGALANHIAATSGGIKELVAEERRQRRGEDAEPVAPRTQPRPAIAKKLRQLAQQNFTDVPTEGNEFTILLARRTESGEVVILGEVADDAQLLERAAKTILG